MQIVQQIDENHAHFEYEINVIGHCSLVIELDQIIYIA